MKALLKKRHIILASLFFAAILFSGVHIVFADDSTPCYTDNGLSAISSLFPSQYCSASGTIPTIINLLLSFLGIVAVFFIIVGGYRMVVSAGNEEAFVKGRQTVLYAIIGLLVAIFAYAIVAIVGNAVVNNSSSSTSDSLSTQVSLQTLTSLGTLITKI